MSDSSTEGRLLQRGRVLEGITLSWNGVGIVVLAIAASGARSVARPGFGLDSVIEIGASTVVLWELAESGVNRQQRALQLIGTAFVALALTSPSSLRSSSLLATTPGTARSVSLGQR